MTARTRHFPIIDFGGRNGVNFPFNLSKIILDRLKWSRNALFPLNHGSSRVTAKKRHFLIIGFGEGVVSKIVASGNPRLRTPQVYTAWSGSNVK